MNPLQKLLETGPNILILNQSFLATFQRYNPDEGLEGDIGWLNLPTEIGGGFTISQDILDSAKTAENGTVTFSADGYDWSLEAYHGIRHDTDKTWLGFTLRQLETLHAALDLFCRIGIGQFEAAGDTICQLHYKKALETDRTGWDIKEEFLNPLKSLFGFPSNGSHGITHPEVHERAKIAHDLGDAVLTAARMKKNPEQGGTTSLKTSQEPAPETLP